MEKVVFGGTEMRVVTPGHYYMLAQIDGNREEPLVFVQRVGKGYPGNESAYAGTNCQEVCRALINRLQYLNGQIPDDRNDEAIEHIRSVIRLLEYRAAERHHRPMPNMSGPVELLSTCDKCGHIGCEGAQ